MKNTGEAEKTLMERFGKDSIIALATVEDGAPYVRNVNAFYENGSFYVITYELSNKIRQIRKNPQVAVAGEWFTAKGVGVDLGYIGEFRNVELAGKLRQVFAEWIDNGHVDFQDINTCILQVMLKNGTLFSNGAQYEITFGG